MKTIDLCFFVTGKILITVSWRALAFKEAWPSPYHYCSILLGRRYHLTSIELWSAYFDLETNIPEKKIKTY